MESTTTTTLTIDFDDALDAVGVERRDATFGTLIRGAKILTRDYVERTGGTFNVHDYVETIIHVADETVETFAFHTVPTVRTRRLREYMKAG